MRIVVESQEEVFSAAPCSNVVYRYWVNDTERPPLTPDDGYFMAALLRMVADRIVQRAVAGAVGNETEAKVVREQVRVAENALRAARRDLDVSLIALAKQKGVHAAASEFGLKANQVEAVLRRHAIPAAVA